MEENTNPSNPGKKKILIVEDDEMLSEIYRKKFGEGEYDLTLVKNGKDAVDEIGKIKPDLVLLDLVMPEMDGFEALKLLKGNPGTKDIKVVIASNLSQESEKEKALELGATDFLIKSNYDLGELSEKIKSYLA